MRPNQKGPFRASPKRENKYSALAECFPALPVRPQLNLMVTPPRVPTQNKPPTMTILGTIPKKDSPFQQASSKASTSQTAKVLTSADYAMKVPESFAHAVNPQTPSKAEEKKPISFEKETFELIPREPIKVLALEKGYENYDLADLIRPCYTDRNYVETSDPMKTRRYYELVLTDTKSVSFEHTLYDERDPTSIRISKFTINKVMSPFEWGMDHLHTPIGLSVQYRPQTYNFKDYVDAWYNFLFLRPKTHTWFVKYSEQAQKSVIPRWFYDWWNTFGGTEQTMPRSFHIHYERFQLENEISTLPNHIKLCKYYFAKRISFIINWSFEIEQIDRIKYLVKTPKIKGWIPEVKETRKSKPVKTEPDNSQKELKKKLLDMLANIDSTDPTQVQAMLEAASSSSSTESRKNGDMEDLDGIASAYRRQ